MIELLDSSKYKEEILLQIEEYKNNKKLTKKEAGLVLYMKAEIMGQFEIINQDDWYELQKKIINTFGIDLEEMEEIIF